MTNAVRDPVRTLLDDLEELRQVAPSASLRDLEALMMRAGKPSSKTKIGNTLKGQTVPDWSFVEAFVEACYKHKKKPLSDAERTSWRRRHGEAEDWQERNAGVEPGTDADAGREQLVEPADSPEPPVDTALRSRRRVLIIAAVAGGIVIAATIAGVMIGTKSKDGVVARLPSYEGNVVQAPNGSRFWIRNGQKRYFVGDIMLKCLQGRAGVGNVINVSSEVINAFRVGPDAYCPYEQEQGLNFVQEGDSYDPGRPVWLVGIDDKGVPFKSLVRRLCVDDPRDAKVAKQYRVGMVPVDETTGRYQGPDFWGDNGGPTCQALPKRPG